MTPESRGQRWIRTDVHGCLAQLWHQLFHGLPLQHSPGYNWAGSVLPAQVKSTEHGGEFEQNKLKESDLQLELLLIPTFAGLNVVNSHVYRLMDPLLKNGTYE